MIAKSLDIVVLLKLLSHNEKRSYAALSKELFISASETPKPSPWNPALWAVAPPRNGYRPYESRHAWPLWTGIAKTRTPPLAAAESE